MIVNKGIADVSTVPLVTSVEKVFDVLSEGNKIEESPTAQTSYSKVLGAHKWGDDELLDQEGPRLWSKVVSKASTLVVQGMELDFIAPEVREGISVANLQKDDAQRMEETWEFAVMVFVVGLKPVNYHF